MERQINVTEFILLGISSDPCLQIFLFLVLLIIYLVTLMGNMVIILVIRIDPELCNPMYFFLSCLSCLDIFYSSVTIPQMLQNLLSQEKTISAVGCFAQTFLIMFSGCTEGFMLSVMAHDRYVAICDPLHYVSIMSKRVRIQLVGGACTSFLHALINTLLLLNVNFCGPKEVSHFICELPYLLPLSCTETLANDVVLLSCVVTFGLMSFLPIMVSYVHIISTILRICSTEGRRKAFSTCSSHFIMVGLLYVSALVQYMKFSSTSSLVLDELLSIQYSILTPMLNPIIYSLKNMEVQKAVMKILVKLKFLKYATVRALH
ncbi:olfactory receptor 8S1-like [Alligator sinensis]|uniref:Olfactory receptor 8S1-like n=1 Tax=Alligator sinensis TaxID=38654 RepID=A0A3Q0HAF3_ALLSI|nr:olfactory receptor 8S1-like [Alligator sinensis]